MQVWSARTVLKGSYCTATKQPHTTAPFYIHKHTFPINVCVIYVYVCLCVEVLSATFPSSLVMLSSTQTGTM